MKNGDNKSVVDREENVSSDDDTAIPSVDQIEVIWGAASIGRLIGVSPSKVRAYFHERDSAGAKHPIGEMMWQESGPGGSGVKLCIDRNEYLRYLDSLRNANTDDE